MKSPKLLLLFISVFLICQTSFGQNQKSNKKPFTADKIVKVIDQDVKLSAEQKQALKVRTLSVINKMKNSKTRELKDSALVQFREFTDSLLTDEQKRIKREKLTIRCDKALRERKEKTSKKNQ